MIVSADLTLYIFTHFIFLHFSVHRYTWVTDAFIWQMDGCWRDKYQ
jgi:hypothetical protein